MYLFLTPSKTDGRIPSQQGEPDSLQPDLLGSFPADVCPDLIGQIGCGHRATIHHIRGGGGGGGEGKEVSDKYYISPTLDIKYPQTP